MGLVAGSAMTANACTTGSLVGPWTYGETQQERPGAIDRQVLDEVMEGGAAVVGRRMYDVTEGWGG